MPDISVYMIKLECNETLDDPHNECIKHKYKVASTHDRAVSVASKWCMDICECLLLPHNEFSIRNDLMKNNKYELNVFKMTIEKMKLY